MVKKVHGSSEKMTCAKLAAARVANTASVSHAETCAASYMSWTERAASQHTIAAHCLVHAACCLSDARQLDCQEHMHSASCKQSVQEALFCALFSPSIMSNTAPLTWVTLDGGRNTSCDSWKFANGPPSVGCAWPAAPAPAARKTAAAATSSMRALEAILQLKITCSNGSKVFMFAGIEQLDEGKSTLWIVQSELWDQAEVETRKARHRTIGC